MSARISNTLARGRELDRTPSLFLLAVQSSREREREFEREREG